MGRKRYTVESIVRMLREVEVELATASTIKHVAKNLDGSWPGDPPVSKSLDLTFESVSSI